MHVAGLQADHGRAGRATHRLGQRIRPKPSLAIDGDFDGCTETEVAKREVDDLVPLPADVDRDPRRSEQSPQVEVPPGQTQEVLSAGRETDKVAHGGSCGEADV